MPRRPDWRKEKGTPECSWSEKSSSLREGDEPRRGKEWSERSPKFGINLRWCKWHNIAVEDEMLSDEVVTTHTFNERIPHHARVLDGSEDGKLLTFYDDDEKKS